MFIVCNEELAPICVWLAAVGHGDHAALCMFQGISDLISKLAIGGGVYALATFASPCRITTLHSNVDTNTTGYGQLGIQPRNFQIS